MILALHAPPFAADQDIDEFPVVHVHAAVEINIFRVDAQGVAAEDMVIRQSAKQIVRRGDGVKISRKMQVDVRHGHHLRIPSARGAALDAENGAERRLPQREAHFLSELFHAVGKTDGNGGFPLARGGGIDGGH